MPKSTKRIRQVADMIQRYLSQALRQEIKDPRLSNVVITDVAVSPDLRNAKVYFSIVNDSELTETQEVLNRAVGHFRHIIATHIDLRYTPVLHFYYDETAAYAEKLGRLLKDIDEKKNEES
jgi:ribosome-binding factor A